MAFPAIESVQTSSDNQDGGAAVSGATAATSHSVTLPTPITAGSLLMVFGRVAATGGTVAVTGGGWTITQDTSDGSNNTAFWMYRNTLADGTEDGTTITVTHSSAKMVAWSCSITGAEDPATRAPQSSTVAVGTSTTPNPTTCTPTGGAKDYLWIWFGSWEGEQTLSKTAPTNYTDRADITTGTGGAVTSNCQMKCGDFQNNAASEDAGSITISASDDWTAWVIAIHPTSGTTQSPNPVTAASSVAGPTVQLTQALTALTTLFGVTAPTVAMALAQQPVTAASTVASTTQAATFVPSPVTAAGGVAALSSDMALGLSPVTAVFSVPDVVAGRLELVEFAAAAFSVTETAQALAYAPSPVTTTAAVVAPTIALARDVSPVTVAAGIAAPTTALASAVAPVGIAGTVPDVQAGEEGSEQVSPVAFSAAVAGVSSAMALTGGQASSGTTIADPSVESSYAPQPIIVTATLGAVEADFLERIVCANGPPTSGILTPYAAAALPA